MTSMPDLHDVYARLVSASAGETGFAPCVQAMAEAFGAAGAVAHEVDRTRGRIRTWVGHALNEGEDEYRDHINRINPRVRYAMRHAPGHVVYEDRFIDARGMDRHTFYDWLRARHGFRHFIGVRLFDDGPVSVLLSVEFEASRGHPDRDAIEAFRRIASTFGNAWRLAGRTGPGSDGPSPWAPDHLPWAILALDGGGRVLEANRQARALLADGTALILADGRPRATHPQSTGAFRNALKRGLSGDAADTQLHVAADPVPLLAQIVPVAVVGVTEPGRVAAVVYIRDPRATPEGLPIVLARAYGFTPAEVRLAEHLARGLDLAGAAAALGITRNTARNQLQAMFDKTGTRRQTDLLHRFASLVIAPDGA